MASPEVARALERAAAEAVTSIVDTLGIPARDYRDAVEHEYQGIVMTMAPLVRRAVVVGEPATQDHLETVAQCCRRLVDGGVTLSTALSFMPVAMTHVCTSASAGDPGAPGPTGADAATWVRRTTTYSQQVSLVCLDVWGAAADAATTAAPHLLVPVVPGASLADLVDAPGTPSLGSTDAQMLLLVAEGRSNQQIASEMSYSSQAVRWRLARMMRRWQVANRASLVTVGFQRGLLHRAPARRPSPDGRSRGAPPGGPHRADALAQHRRGGPRLRSRGT